MDFLAARMPKLTEIRHALHANPELSRQEVETAGFVARELASAGITVHRDFGGHGVVGVIEGASAGPGVALRADMDALEITELGDRPYKSRKAGRMHACGHDGHMTMLLGAAFYLAETRRFRGTVHLVFQPAEERYGGAQLMLDHGLLERFSIRNIFAVHNGPGMPSGKILIQDGPVMAGSSEFDITFRAEGGHAAMPHLTGDPIYAGGHFLTSIQQAVGRALDPLEAGVVTIGAFQSGFAQNIIPETALLSGTLRAFTRQGLDRLRGRVEVIAAAAAAVANTRHEICFDDPMIPPVINGLGEAAIMREAARRVAGADALIARPPTMAGDDFGVFLENMPGAYAWIGNGPADDGNRLHQPYYDFNDAIIPVGAAFLAATAEHALSIA